MMRRTTSRRDQSNTLRAAFLPCLVAVHEMFRIRAYYLKAEGLNRELSRRGKKDEYNEGVLKLFQRLRDKNGAPIDGTPRACVEGLLQPEYLIMPEQLPDGASQLYSYRHGEVVAGVDPAVESDSGALIRLLAELCQGVSPGDGDFWYRLPGGNETNDHNCLL